MGSPSLTFTKPTTTNCKKMFSSNLLLSSLLLSTMMMSTHAAVAVGLGQLNPDNSGECLDPDTGLSHDLGSPWSVSGCGEAKCDLRQGTVFISYSYCGNVYAEPGCYVQQDSF